MAWTLRLVERWDIIGQGIFAEHGEFGTVVAGAVAVEADFPC